MWVLSRTSEILGKHVQGRLAVEKTMCEGEQPVWFPQETLICPFGGSSAFSRGVLCVQEHTYSEQERDWTFIAWWLLVAQVYEMNVLISYIFKNIYELWGSERWDSEVVECWCQQFLTVAGFGCACFGWKHINSLHFNAASSHSSWVCNAQSCWVSPVMLEFHSLPPFVFNYFIYPEQSITSIYAELLNFYKLNGMSSKHQAKHWKSANFIRLEWKMHSLLTSDIWE